MKYLPYIVHCIAIHSSCNKVVQILWSIFHIMLTVTHSIQAAIPLSTCCDVSSIAWTLSLRSYHIQRPSSALSTIYLNAPNKNHRSKTQQAFPNGFHIAAVLAAAWLYLKCLLGISYLRNLVHGLPSSEKSTLHILIISKQRCYNGHFQFP